MDNYERQEILSFLDKNYYDDNVNNNKHVLFNDPTEISDIFRFKSMKQSSFKNAIYKNSLFENVALTGSTFENVKYIDTKLIGSSFANCYFYNAEINGTRAAFPANNFSQSNFEQCVFRKIKFFRSGILNTLYHRCKFEKTKFRGSTLEGTQFISCSFSDCDLGNVNLDYTVFSKNTYNKLILPFYQIAYIIGAAEFVCDPDIKIYVRAGKKIHSVATYFEQAPNLIVYYLDKSEYFPACNLCIAMKDFEKAKQYLLTGVEQALENKNFRMISNYCRLAKFHNIADEHLKKKILSAINKFIQSDQMPESQLNYSLVYIGNIKTLLNEGSGDAVKLSYTIRTDTCKKNSAGVRYVNNMVQNLNDELACLDGIEGYEVKITNHSPFEIAVAIIGLVIMLPPAIDAVMNIVTKIRNGLAERKKKKEPENDTQKIYFRKDIDIVQNEVRKRQDLYSTKELVEHVVSVTQIITTDDETMHSKEIMIYEIKKRT